ncbi:MAG: lamin tail domain-containing protein [Chloroflexi bacterium]|nr:lamin tail domain-containing protein [Chloroflexota bacterium]MQC27292.1 lamin tail domain-containing protein [Chloroflexota bacterium]
MDDRKPLKTYLLINVAVSALTTLLVLVVWNLINAPDAPLSPSDPTTFSLVTDTPAPTVNPGAYAGQLAISAIIGAGDLQNERVTIMHVGDLDISLAGWRLIDSDGNAYQFPALVLHPGASVELFSRTGEDNVNQLFWNRSKPVWEEGEEAALRDPENETQATYTVP